MERIRIITIGSLLLLAVIAGCSSSDKDEPPMGSFTMPPPPQMVGSWIFQSVTVNGAAASLASVQEWVPQTVQSKVHIQANNAYIYEEVNISGGQLWFESGFLVIEGDSVDIVAQMDSDGSSNESTRMAYTVNDTMMTLDYSEVGQSIQFTLKK